MYMFSPILTAGESARKWEYEMLSCITKLQNVCDGTWDYGIRNEDDVEGEKIKLEVTPEQLDFLSKRSDLFKSRKQGLALYLLRYKFAGVEKLWLKLLASAAESSEVDKKFKIKFPSSRDKVLETSIGLLYLDAYKKM